VFVNKLDRSAADFAASVESLRERVGACPVIISIPLRSAQGELLGIGDVVRGSASAAEGDLSALDLARFRQELQLARDLLVEACAELDDELLESVLAERPISEALLLAALRRLTIRGLVVPVAAGSALTGAGVDILLDAVGSMLPSFLDRNRLGFEDWFPAPVPEQPMRALVFKVDHQDLETLAYVRVLEGAMVPGMRVHASGLAEPFQVASLHVPQAGSRLHCHRAETGAIVMLSVPASIRTGDTLAERPGAPDLPRCEYPSPVVSVLFEPGDSADVTAIQDALARI
jgi:elongation factor G